MHQLITESEIRNAILGRISSARKNGLVVQELGLCQGNSRIDIAYVDKRLIGFEIKSDFDSLKRLPNQVAHFNSIFDQMYLVTTEKHLARALKKIPSTWGVLVVQRGPDAQVKMITKRASKSNKEVSGENLVQLLWKDEVIHFLKELDVKLSFHGKSKNELYQLLVENCGLRFLQRFVINALKNRNGWRVAQKLA